MGTRDHPGRVQRMLVVPRHDNKDGAPQNNLGDDETERDEEELKDDDPRRAHEDATSSAARVCTPCDNLHHAEKDACACDCDGCCDASGCSPGQA